MWLFGKKKHQEAPQGNPMETVISQQEQEAYFEIVKQIAPHDPEVLHELREGFSNSEKYVGQHRERLQEEGWLEHEKVLECVQDPWWLMLDILQRYGYVCVRDWKDEWQDFRFFLCQTKRAQQEGIQIEASDPDFLEQGDISEWCRQLDEKLTERNLVVGNIDTESDAYAVFFCTREELDSLRQSASLLHQKIDFAKDA